MLQHNQGISWNCLAAVTVSAETTLPNIKMKAKESKLLS